VSAWWGRVNAAKARWRERSPRGRLLLDLEDPTSEARLYDPKLALEPLRGLVEIDEVQRRPDLMPLLRVLAEPRPFPSRFLLLGSAAPELIRSASESLAAGSSFVEMRGSRSTRWATRRCVRCGVAVVSLCLTWRQTTGTA
jgi:hypothetical protein